MNNIYEEIRSNSGIDDVEYLEEGIVFFKNSSKIKRLVKRLNQKHVQLTKSNKMQEAATLSSLIREAEKVALSFEAVEKEFRMVRGKDQKNMVKEKYSKLEKEFISLIKIANKETTRKVISTIGAGALVAGVLAAGAFGIHSLVQSGVMDKVALNLKSRAQLFGLDQETEITTSDNNIEKFKKIGQRAIGTSIISQTIKNTNKDLVAASTVAGATVGGVLSVGAISELRKLGIKNKTIAATVRAIEDLRSDESKKTTPKDTPKEKKE